MSGSDCKKLLFFILFFLMTINQASGGEVDIKQVGGEVDICNANRESDIKQVSEEVDLSNASGGVYDCLYKNKEGKVICPLVSDVFYKHEIDKINKKTIKYKDDGKKQSELNEKLKILDNMFRTEVYSSPNLYMNTDLPFVEKMIKSDDVEIKKIFKKIQKEEKSLCLMKGELSKCENYKVDKSMSSSRSRDKRYKLSTEIAHKDSLINDLKKEYTNAVKEKPDSSKVFRVTGVLLPLLVNLEDKNKCDDCGESTDNRHKLACLTFRRPYMERCIPNEFYSRLSQLSNEDKDKDEFKELMTMFRDSNGKIEKHTCCDCWLTNNGDHKDRDYRINGKLSHATPGFKLSVVRLARFDIENNKKLLETQGAAQAAVSNSDQTILDTQKLESIP